MKCSPCRRSALRMRGIWSLGRGVDRVSVALFCNVHEHTVIEWIKLFNEQGIDGLIEKTRKGAPRKLSREELQAKVLPLIEDPSKAGETHWTIVKLHGYLSKECQTVVSYSSLLRHLHQEGYVQKLPRSMPEAPDPEDWKLRREQFKEDLSQWMADPATELWFCDECGIEADPRPRKRWVIKGSKPTIGYAGTHIRRSVIGAVHPQSGALSALIFSHCNTDVFQAFLDNLAHEYPPKPNKSYRLILDNATWHKAKKLNWHHFIPTYLPSYSPDFNPIERLWRMIKSSFFADFFTRQAVQLEKRIIHALQSCFQRQDSVAQTCAISGNF